MAELDEEPAQTLLMAGPLADEVLAMVDQQADSSRSGPSRVATGRSGSRSDGPGDGEGVDRVALARLPARPAGPAISLGGTRTTGLAGPDELGVEPAGQVAAVLEAPSVRSGHWAAQRRSSRWPASVAAIVFSAELAARSSSITTTV